MYKVHEHTFSKLNLVAICSDINQSIPINMYQFVLEVEIVG